MHPAARSAEMMLEIIELIDAQMLGETRERFLATSTTQEVLAFRLLRVGEAAGRMPDEDKARHPEIPWRAITGLRNLIAHNYDDVEVGILHSIAVSNIPALAAACRAIMAHHGETF